jgi:hypothetical protein
VVGAAAALVAAETPCGGAGGTFEPALAFAGATDLAGVGAELAFAVAAGFTAFV